MAVDDFGIEVLKKAAEEITEGDKSEYRIRTNNFDPNISIFGETLVGERNHDISIAFNYNIASRDVNTALTGTGTAESDQNTLKITPGTSVGTSSVKSIDTITYRAGTEAFAMFTMALEDGGEAGLDQGIGPTDDDNGFFIGFNGATFSVGRRKAGTDTWTARDNFNGENTSFLDPTKLNIYLIRYGWLGIAPICYFIYHGPSRSFKLLHATDLTNVQTLPHINTPTLPICAFSVRASGTGIAQVLRSGSWRGGVVDGKIGKFRHFSDKNTKLTVTSTLTSIFTLRNKTTYQGITNKVSAIIELVSFASDGAKSVEIELIINATIGGTPVFSDIDVNNSVMERDVAGTTVADGILLATFYLSKVDGGVVNLLPYNYRWFPGDTLTFAGKTVSGNSDVSFSGNWGEVF